MSSSSSHNSFSGSKTNAAEGQNSIDGLSLKKTTSPFILTAYPSNEEKKVKETDIVPDENKVNELDVHKQSTEFSKQESVSNDDDTNIQLIPENNMKIVVPALILTLFLAALDNTIVTTALPTIAEDFNDTSSSSWIGSAYVLASNAVLPAVGVFCNILGRKIVLYICIFFFMLGSALCGASQNMIWLIVCRAIQGLGGGGIISLVNIIISDITPLRTRPMYSGILATAWGAALVAGPIIGGAICQRTTWRWIFFINLPSGGIATALIVVFLHLLPCERTSFKKFLKTFDFIGLVCVITGIVLILLGISLGASSGKWRRANILCYLIIGGCLFVFAFIYDTFTKRNAVLPPPFFKNRSSAALLACSSFFYLNYMLFAYYVPQYFQRIRGDNPIMSGVHTIPCAAVLCFFCTTVGMVLRKLGRYLPLIYVGYISCVAGMGAMICVNATTSMSKVMGLTTIFMFGSGFLFLPPLIAMQATFPPAMTSMATATLMFIRTMGGSIGITVGEVIFNERVTQSFDGNTTYAQLSYKQVERLPQELQIRVKNTYASAFRVIWIFCTVVMAIGFASIFFIKSRPLTSNAQSVPAKKKGDSDEKPAEKV
ncbi:MFS transporter [Schizosaccharomyces pombe]